MNYIILLLSVTSFLSLYENVPCIVTSPSIHYLTARISSLLAKCLQKTFAVNLVSITNIIFQLGRRKTIEISIALHSEELGKIAVKQCRESDLDTGCAMLLGDYRLRMYFRYRQMHYFSRHHYPGSLYASINARRFSQSCCGKTSSSLLRHGGTCCYGEEAGTCVSSTSFLTN